MTDYVLIMQKKKLINEQGMFRAITHGSNPQNNGRDMTSHVVVKLFSVYILTMEKENMNMPLLICTGRSNGSQIR